MLTIPELSERIFHGLTADLGDLNLTLISNLKMFSVVSKECNAIAKRIKVDGHVNDLEQCLAVYYTKMGYMSCLEYTLSTSTAKSFEGIVCCAASYGNLDAMRFLIPLNVDTHRHATAKAAEGGSLECLKYAESMNYGRLHPKLHVSAAGAGSLECIKYLRERGVELTIEACVKAVEKNHYECFEYLLERLALFDLCGPQKGKEKPHPWCEDSDGCVTDLHISELAAKHGDLRYIDALRKRNGRLSKKAMNIAADRGHLEFIKHLLVHGCECTTTACYNAAKKGHLNILAYLIENGCPWNTRMCEAAATNGHLDCLKYTVENGGFTKKAVGCAILNGRVDCLRYLDQHEEIDWDGLSTAELYGLTKHLECFVYAVERGFTMYSHALQYAYSRRHFNVIDYMIEQNHFVGNLVLHAMIEEYDFKRLEKVLASGIEVNAFLLSVAHKVCSNTLMGVTEDYPKAVKILNMLQGLYTGGRAQEADETMY